MAFDVHVVVAALYLAMYVYIYRSEPDNINLEIRGGTTEAKSEIGFFGPSMRSSR